VDEILTEVDNMEREQKAIKKEVFKLSWYMRGGMNLNEAYTLSVEERQIIGDIVKENLEVTKSSGLPFY